MNTKKYCAVAGFVLLAVLWLLGCGLLAGCGTVAPQTIHARRASFDPLPDARGAHANSGALAFTNHQLILTPTAVARYDALATKWGGHFLPPLVAPFTNGLTPLTNGTTLMDKAHVDLMGTMLQWQINPPAAAPP